MMQLYIFSRISGFSQYKFLQRKDKKVYFQTICKPGVDKQVIKEKVLATWQEHFGEHPFEVEFLNELPINVKTGKFKKMEVEI